MGHYDVAIVGAGPVGSFCALAHAQRGARVALLEANLKASRRLAGEWLHPPAVDALRDAGVPLRDHPGSSVGKGFVVFPEGDEAPISLPYRTGPFGLTCDHATIVSELRRAVANERAIDFICSAKVRAVEARELTFSQQGNTHALRAGRIVGADGRASVVRQSLGLPSRRMTCSRMVGVLLKGVSLPFAGYGHVILGAPGPILIYDLGGQSVRVMADVPVERWEPQSRMALLEHCYAPLLPVELRAAFVEAVRERRVVVAANEIRPRTSYGTADRVLIGDAAGNYHPMTAVGLTLGFGDALALAEGGDFEAFVTGRTRATRAPELLALGLYEVFADHRAESVSLRQTVYRRWRTSPEVRERTVAMLACEDTSASRLGVTLAGLVARAVATAILRAFGQGSSSGGKPLPLARPGGRVGSSAGAELLSPRAEGSSLALPQAEGSSSEGKPLALPQAEGSWHRPGATVRALVLRVVWLARGISLLRNARRTKDRNGEAQVRAALARAFLRSMPVRRCPTDP